MKNPCNISIELALNIQMDACNFFTESDKKSYVYLTNNINLFNKCKAA